MDEDFITLEVEEEGCGRLQFELPLDITDEEIAYIKSLVPRAESRIARTPRSGYGRSCVQLHPRAGALTSPARPTPSSGSVLGSGTALPPDFIVKLRIVG